MKQIHWSVKCKVNSLNEKYKDGLVIDDEGNVTITAVYLTMDGALEGIETMRDQVKNNWYGDLEILDVTIKTEVK